MRARVVLPLPCAQRGSDRTRERGDPDRALEHRDIAEHFDRLHHGDGICALAREHQHGKIGPRRLPPDERCEQLAAALHRLLGEKHGGRAPIDLPRHRLGVLADVAFDAALAQHGAGERRVLPRGCQNEESPFQPVLREISCAHRSFAAAT